MQKTNPASSVLPTHRGWTGSMARPVRCKRILHREHTTIHLESGRTAHRLQLRFQCSRSGYHRGHRTGVLSREEFLERISIVQIKFSN